MLFNFKIKNKNNYKKYLIKYEFNKNSEYFIIIKPFFYLNLLII